ncbi:MAG TPA: hypothetical protein VFA01_09605 [Candidatus Dormibacteraeota bacterium]|nr:hypothetical protein [Candidatus Dormibacteraeota bacterium]
MRDLVKAFRLLFWGTLAAAVYQELKKPPTLRTWHGKVGGVVPYDFRVPTLERIRDAYWNPNSDRVFSERVIGVGWAINIPTAARKLAEIVQQYIEASRDAAERLRPPQAS